MIKIEIKNRFTGKILFEYSKENNTVKETLVEAVSKGANLEGANLRGADLKGADLEGADLEGADLKGADLKWADLEGADLEGANLEGADLEGAYLKGADLEGANLRGADLKGADLKWAYLEGADLEGANLSSIKNDFWEILLKTKNEIPGLKKALINGKIDGSCYEGECCCLVGTIAKLKQCEYRTLEGVAPNASRPAESWFTNIDPGDTPENSQVVKITLEWIEEFELYLNK